MKRVITITNPPAPVLLLRKKVAAYARVSSGKDAMLHSLAAQVGFYSEKIRRNPNWEYAGVYADEALTGTKDNRPEYQRLLADCRAGKIDLVLTKSISRFARNTVDLLETVRELKLLGVDVFFEEQNIHTISGDGELMLTILASYAQEESRSASENQKWRVQKNYSEGKLASPISIYGYDCKSGALTIIPEEAEVVRMIFADFLGGMGKNAIMKKLDGLGVPTKSKGLWSEFHISCILQNEKYIGDLLLQKKYVSDHLTKRLKNNKGELPQFYVEGSHDPIVDRATFDAVQAEFKRRATSSGNAGKGSVSEFTGMIHCLRCGANFQKKINSCGTKYAKVTWACATFTSRGKACCPAKRIPEDILRQKCAEVLGLDQYDAEVFKSKVKGINVPDDGVLVFHFIDGAEVRTTWKHRSRSESWTQEMRDAMRKSPKGTKQNG